MTTIRWVLCATDFSPAARAAWEEAQLLGDIFRVEVLLLHVLAPPILPGATDVSPVLWEDVTGTAYRAARQELDRLVVSRSRRYVKVAPRIELGPAAARILQVADEQAGGVLVLGVHPRGPLSRALLGSVADRVVREARCPVLAVPARTGEARGRAARIDRICYATDFLPSADAAWPWAAAVADAAGAYMDLLHVVVPPALELPMPADGLGKMAQRLHAEATARATQFLGEHPFSGKEPQVLIGWGDPGEEILRQARIRAADLVVMGTHGRSPLASWILGSVAQHVVQASPRPLLIVGPGQHRPVPRPPEAVIAQRAAERESCELPSR
jgi:nucleotide-binding universal stress UspA family protein